MSPNSFFSDDETSKSGFCSRVERWQPYARMRPVSVFSTNCLIYTGFSMNEHARDDRKPSDTNLGTLAKMHGYACQDLGKILPRSYQGYHDHARSWQG